MEEKYQYLAILCIAYICYCNTLFGEFVFDDSEAIVKNKDVRPTTPILDVFKNDFWGTNIASNLSHKSYRPLTILTYRLNVILSNNTLSAFHFHSANITLYIILCMLTIPLYNLFLSRKRARKWTEDVPFLSALLFTVHPIHTEVVAALVGRADILSSILFITSILLYKRVVRTDSKLVFGVVTVVIGAAVLCKEIAITALALCSIFDIFYTKRLLRCSLRQLLRSRRFISRNVSLFVAGLTIMYLRLWVMNFQGPTFAKIDNPAAFTDSLISKIFTYNYIYFLNLLLLLWPQWLCFDWSMGCVPLIEDICDIRVIFVIVLWMGLTSTFYLILKQIRADSVSITTILAFAIIIFPFIPASNIFILVGFVVAERTLLLPSVGFCLLVVLGFQKLSTSRKHGKIIQVVFHMLCVVFALRTIQRNFDWLDEESLFASALTVCPLNAKVHYNVAKVAADTNNRRLAIEEYNKAIELNPEYAQAMNNLANLLREDRRFSEAEVLLRRAVKIRTKFAAAWMNLGIVLTNLNQSNEAEECYLKAISYRASYPDCYYNLGNFYLDMKRNDDALAAWARAVHLRPTHTAAWGNTLVLLDSLGKYEDVLNFGRIALMHNPKSPALHFSVANTLGKIHEFEKAEKHFLEALNFNPYNALYYSNLGVLYHRWGKSEKARYMYKKALKIDPTMKTTQANLRKLLNPDNGEVIY